MLVSPTEKKYAIKSHNSIELIHIINVLFNSLSFKVSYYFLILSIIFWEYSLLKCYRKLQNKLTVHQIK